MKVVLSSTAVSTATTKVLIVVLAAVLALASLRGTAASSHDGWNTMFHRPSPSIVAKTPVGSSKRRLISSSSSSFFSFGRRRRHHHRSGLVLLPNNNDDQVDDDNGTKMYNVDENQIQPPRGGGTGTGTGTGTGKFQFYKDKVEATSTSKRDPLDMLVQTIGTVTQTLISFGKVVLPPTVQFIQSIVGVYQALPQDAILAQVGLVYCFAGGYYPTLFSSLQAARHCGWDVMVGAIQDLTDEALHVIDVTASSTSSSSRSRSSSRDDDDETLFPSRKDLFLHQTNIVLKTVDPMKINQAAGALYTTWLGVSAVLQKEYARVISLSLTMSYYLERATHWILEPPIKLLVPKDYHKWVPVILGWGCKGIAMNICWRIQRILTASTSAMFGGVMFARALLRMAHGRGMTFFGLVDETGSESPLDEVIGFTVAGIGFYTQLETQRRNNFSFQVPFPLRLITWPFDYLERWIQWSITKENEYA